MKKVRTHSFNGISYEIILDKLDGFADTHKLKRTLVISRDINELVGLETAIHEALHACNWHSREELVETTAKDIARFLWRLGFRRT